MHVNPARMDAVANLQLIDEAPASARCVSEALDALRARGYLILERLVDCDFVERVCGELERWFEATPRCEGDFYGWDTTRLNSILLKAPSSHALLLHRFILDIMDAVLGPHCDWYQLNLSQAVRLHPGQRQQIPHRDDEMWPCPKSGIEFMVNVMWALSDFTAENGATLLWPRSHVGAPKRSLDAAQAVSATMPRGSALIYFGSLTHCGGANCSTEPRTGLIFSYSLGWLKPYENPFLSYPPAIARSFPKAVRDLLGYRIHRPNLGSYEGQDPAVALVTDSRTLPTLDALPESIAAELRAFHANAKSVPGQLGT